MARITPIDVIKGISGKFGGDSNEYFATNSSSNSIHLAKLAHPFQGEATARQKEVQQQFKSRALAASQWLRNNKPSDENGDKGTELYQEAQTIKKQLHLSNVRQVVEKYMDDDGKVTLPSEYSDEDGD